MAKTLLQKAMEVPVQRRNEVVVTAQMKELAIAWCMGTVTIGQVAKSLGLHGTGHQAYAKVALALKQWYNEQNRIPEK